MFEDPDDVIARVQDDVRRAQQRAERLPQLTAAVAEVRGEARSPQRDVWVEVDGSGALVGLDITDEAWARRGRQISTDVVALVAEARRVAQRRILEATESILGAGDPAYAAILAEADAADAEAGTLR